MAHERVGEGARVVDDLLLVGAQLRGLRLAEATALAAMTCMSGPPWMPGKTTRSSALACAARHMIMPPRGPRSVLCVVVVTKSAWGTGEGWSARRDQARDVRDVDHEGRAHLVARSRRMRAKSMMRG